MTQAEYINEKFSSVAEQVEQFAEEYEWYSKRFWTLLGYPACGPFPSNEHQSFLDHLHPEDVEATRNAVKKVALMVRITITNIDCDC